jgi:hypothetical protein
MNNLQAVLLLLLATATLCVEPNTAGFTIGQVKQYKLLKKSG